MCPVIKTRPAIEIINKNNYVGVENLLQDKKGKTDASSIPSTGSVIGFEKDDILLGKGTSGTKKKAEQKAAKDAFEKMAK